MRRLILCRGVGTTALKRGEPLEVSQKFFGPGQYEQVPAERVLISSARLAKMTTLKLSTPLVELVLTAAAADPLY